MTLPTLVFCKGAVLLQLLLLSEILPRPLQFVARTRFAPVDRVPLGHGAAGGRKYTTICVCCY